MDIMRNTTLIDQGGVEFLTWQATETVSVN